MARSVSKFILFAVIATGIACESVTEPETRIVPEPEPGFIPLFASLEVRPSTTTLLAGSGKRTVQIEVAVRDHRGSPMQPSEITYSSSDPAVAEVSTTGLVTSVGVGTVAITATVTVGEVVRAGSVTVTVVTAAVDYLLISGVYELEGAVDDCDGWGCEGESFSSVLTIREPSNAPGTVGTFTDLVWRSVEGVVQGPRGSGPVDFHFTGNGSLVLLLGSRELLVDELAAPVAASAASPVIEGTFQSGAASGQFIAKRRGN